MRTCLCTLVLIVFGVSTLAAAVPPTMNYQSLLTTSAGIPVADGSYSVTFSIFGGPTGGSPLWMETQSVLTSEGLFTAILGSTTPIPDTAVMGAATYLEISVASDPPLVPRTRLTSTAFSMMSSALIGEGPIALEHEDVASGTQSIFTVDVKPEGGTGKNIRKNIMVTLPSNNETAELTEVIGLSGATKSAVAIPAFMKNARKAKTAEAASMREFLDIDSGYAHSVTIELPGDTLHMLDIASATGTSSAAVAIPAFMKNARKAKTTEAAESREILDPDSGYVRTVGWTDGDETVEMMDLLVPPGSTSGAVAIPSIIKSRRSTHNSDTSEFREILDPDSGYTMTASRKAPGLLSIVEQSTTQTREHVLLARQVGVSVEQSIELTTVNAGPSIIMTREGTTADPQDDGVVVLTASLPGAAAMSLESSRLGDVSTYAVETEHADGTRARLLRGDGADTSEIEFVADDTEQTLTMSTESGATKWPNIVLKRGATATEMTLSHVSAGATGVIYATANGAAGAQLGINTSTPSLGFHLVGSGCYTGTFGVCSDARYKDHIETLSDPIETVEKLRGVSFDWNRSAYPGQDFPEGEQVGLIAQEVEKVVPGVVQTDSKGYKSVDYARLVPLLIEAVKEQQRQIDDLKLRLDRQTP